MQQVLALRLMLAVAVVQIGLVLLALPAWACPLRKSTGVPCPGCGLTRSIMHLARGDVVGSLRLHAFGWVVALGFLLLAIAAVMPERWRTLWADRMAMLERRIPLLPIMFAGFMLYWCLRLLWPRLGLSSVLAT